VHFALNCASVGCPPLRVYDGDSIDAGLDANGRRYLADPARGARAEGDRLLLTRVTRWFAGDFAPLGPSRTVAAWAALARPARVLPAVRPLLPGPLRGARAVGFLTWDHALNGA
jgi:hypothetical protein